jgi:hypothetical protein
MVKLGESPPRLQPVSDPFTAISLTCSTVLDSTINMLDEFKQQ